MLGGSLLIIAGSRYSVNRSWVPGQVVVQMKIKVKHEDERGVRVDMVIIRGGED